MATKYGNQKLTLMILLAHSIITIVSSTPTNLRIQVNNESIQNAPYLLEAIKQIDNEANIQQPHNNNTNAASNINSALGNGSNTVSTTTTTITGTSTLKPIDHNGSSSRSDPAANHTSLPSSQQLPSSNRTAPAAEEDYEDQSEPNSFSVVKEETIEEIVDLDPEIANKLTPTTANENASHSSSSSSSSGSANQDMASAESHQSADSRESSDAESDKVAALGTPSGSVAHKHERKPQLPVTSSHLKKPAYGAMDDEILEASNSQEAASTALDSNQKSGGTGAKSLVSPSVLADEKPEETPKIALNKNKKPINLPDTLEPSQIMNGVTNASAVPGIVNKEYGHQTRTRITLGGGYVRDRLPPLVNPASDAYVDNKPEKPVTPLEKTRPVQPTTGDKGGATTIDGAAIEADNRDSEEQLGSSSSSNNKKLNNNNQTNKPGKLGKQDSRCPKEGTTTLEHPTACDKYYYCENGLMTEYTCPNGLMYGTREIVLDYCVHRWKADCQDKAIPNPISSPGCRWQYGIFNVQGSPKCSPDFYECTAGKFEVKKCPIDGQIFDDRTKQCRYAEQVGCANEALADFNCPPDDQANTYWPFPRYFLNERALIHCVNDKPEIVRCTDTERVDPEHLHCVPMTKQQESPAPASVNPETRRARERKKSTN